MIKQNKNLFVSHLDEINIECLNISKVWYQYYEPYELDYLTSIGIDQEWTLKNFVEEIPYEEMEIHYSLKNHQLLSREFTFIGCRIAINDKCKLNGYAFKINNEVNTVTAILGSTKYDFLNPVVFADENLETMRSLTGQLGQSPPQRSIVKLEYEDITKQFFDLNNEFHIL